jgi:hypothetical protein
MDRLPTKLSVKGYALGRGLDKFFKTLAKLASSSVFSLTKSENNWPKI